MTNKEKNFVSAVIYVHNAEKNIDEFLKMIINVMEENFEHSEIICVNDSSDDKSLSIISNVSRIATSTSISVINMSYFHGIELSMNAGVDLAIGDFVFEFDNTISDFEPSVIMSVYRRALEGYDIVSASPDRKERFSSKLFYKVFELYSQLSQKMSTETFRVLSRRVINKINSMSKMTPYRKAMYINCGLKVDNIKYKITNSKQGRLNRKDRKYRSSIAVESLILFTEMGYSFSKLMTVIMMLISIFMVVYSVVVYATSNPVAGWTTTILFLSVAFFGLFGILTIVVRYLQILVNLVFKRKHYSFESIEKITK